MITLKSKREIELIRNSGMVVATMLNHLQMIAKPGMTTAELNDHTDSFIKSFDSARPAFLGYRGFPKSVCVSINEEVVHGIPSASKTIHESDVISLDFGAYMKGYYADAALTFQVPPVNDGVEAFLKTCSDALSAGIRNACVNNRIGDISSAIQREVESKGFHVVTTLVGHGIGKNLHEEPQVPNYGNPGEGVLLQEGMVLAIEPMINMGNSEVKTLADEWTVVTADGSLSAHFEHTVVIAKHGHEILTDGKKS